MRTAPPALLPILRSALQGELLALLYLNPEHEYSLSEAARLCRTSVKTLHPEVNRLSKAGLVDERRLGNLRLIHAGDPGPIRLPLTQLLSATYGPIPVLQRELAGVGGVEGAYIYGSWAARHEGVEGPPPNDVDVVVVGSSDRDDLRLAAERAEETLRRDVNIAVISRDGWEKPGDDPFLNSVQQGHLVQLDLHGGGEGGRKVTWHQGQRTIRALIAESKLQRVPPGKAQAERLLDQARTHLEAAESIRELDPSGGYALMYDAARKALVAVLENQGLRPTARGGQVVVFQAARAQLDPPLGTTIRPFDRLRRRRNEVEYPGESAPAVTAQEVADELPKARAILDLARSLLDQMDAFS